MHLRVFVDRALHPHQQAGGFERGEMFAEISVAALGGARRDGVMVLYSLAPGGPARPAVSPSIVPWPRPPALTAPLQGSRRRPGRAGGTPPLAGGPLSACQDGPEPLFRTGSQ